MKSLEEYRLFVRQLSNDNSDKVFLNSDEKHALAVMEEIFKQSTDIVRIFAGNLQHVGNEQSYIIAISDFIERNGKVRILLNNCTNEDMINSNLFKRLAYYIINGKDVQIKLTSVKPYFTSDADKKPIHFSVGDDRAYRIETDIENRKAECSMNLPERASVLIGFFDNLFSNDDKSVNVDIVTLLENGID